MAIQTASLSSAEHDWYATRSGEPSNISTDAHKRSYFVSKGITGTVGGTPDGANKPTSQMETEWLQTLTGVTADNYPDQWLQAVAGQGLTPSVSLSENKFIFFTQVAGSP